MWNDYLWELVLGDSRGEVGSRQRFRVSVRVGDGVGVHVSVRVGFRVNVRVHEGQAGCYGHTDLDVGLLLEQPSGAQLRFSVSL